VPLCLPGLAVPTQHGSTGFAIIAVLRCLSSLAATSNVANAAALQSECASPGVVAQQQHLMTCAAPVGMALGAAAAAAVAAFWAAVLPPRLLDALGWRLVLAGSLVVHTACSTPQVRLLLSGATPATMPPGRGGRSLVGHITTVFETLRCGERECVCVGVVCVLCVCVCVPPVCHLQCDQTISSACINGSNNALQSPAALRGAPLTPTIHMLMWCTPCRGAPRACIAALLLTTFGSSSSHLLVAFTPLYLTHIATLPRRAALAGHAAAMAALAGAVPLGHMLAARHGAAPLLLSTCALAALFAAPAFMLSGLGVGAVAWIAQLVLAIALGLHLGGLTDALVQGLPRQVRKTALLDLRWCCTCCSHLMGWSLLLLLMMMLMMAMMMHST
jgi:hypothetical protein